MSDEQRAADAEKAVDATKQTIWTPDKKVPESVRKMAFVFFLEAWKVYLERPMVAKNEIKLEDEYRACINVARMIQRVDAENDPKV